MLRRPANAALLAMVMAACSTTPPLASDPAPPAIVAARWVAEDGTVVVVNLVVPVGTDARRARQIAERQRPDHFRARVIVHVFAATAGPERYVIGHVPTGTEPLAQASPPPALVGVYDFPP